MTDNAGGISSLINKEEKRIEIKPGSQLENIVSDELFDGTSRYSLHADENRSLIKRSVVFRSLAIFWPLVIGLASNGSLVYMARFGMMALVLLTVIPEIFIFVSKTTNSLMIMIVGFLEIISSLVTSAVVVWQILSSSWNCIAVGQGCPEGQENSFQRFFEVGFDVFILFWTGIAISALYNLYNSYDESDKEEPLERKLV